MILAYRHCRVTLESDSRHDGVGLNPGSSKAVLCCNNQMLSTGACIPHVHGVQCTLYENLKIHMSKNIEYNIPIILICTY